MLMGYSLLSLIIFSLINFLLIGVLRIFAGIIAFLVMSAMLSNYLYLIKNIIKYGKFTLDDIKVGFQAFLWKIYGILFIGWVAGYIFNGIIAPILSTILPVAVINLVVSIIVVILLNPLPEAIYQKFYSSWESITYSFNFIKENWIEWLVPNFILFSIFYFITGRVIGGLFSFIEMGIYFDLSPKGIVLYIIGQILIAFITLYRGVLFEILSTSTRRKRMFMRGIYK
jgi:hypothetical protein